MIKRKLLVISDGYPENTGSGRYNCQFVRTITDLVKDQFEEVKVVSPQAYLPKIFEKLPRLAGIAKMTNYTDYAYDNVEVTYPYFYTLPFPYFRTRNYQFIANTLKNLVVKDKPDLAHIHFAYPTGKAAMGIFPNNTPMVLSLHGGDLYEWALNHQQSAKNIMKQYQAIQVPTQKMKEIVRIIDNSLLSRTHVIPPSIDTSVFHPFNKLECRKLLGISSEEKALLMVANLVDGKGHLDALQVMHNLNDPNLKLYILGAGELMTTITKRVRELGLQNKVILVGAIANDKLPYWYSASDLLLFPSYKESFGIVQAEAMACGLQILAYDNDGSKDILINHPELLVKTGDINKLTSQVKTILAHPLKKQLFKKAVDRLSTEKIREKIMKMYSDILIR